MAFYYFYTVNCVTKYKSLPPGVLSLRVSNALFGQKVFLFHTYVLFLEVLLNKKKKGESLYPKQNVFVSKLYYKRKRAEVNMLRHQWQAHTAGIHN